jgi:hypothetical protein
MDPREAAARNVSSRARGAAVKDMLRDTIRRTRESMSDAGDSECPVQQAWAHLGEPDLVWKASMPSARTSSTMLPCMTLSSCKAL